MAYARAPITEAIIELRFAGSFSQSVVEAAGRRLRSDYVFFDPENAIQFKLEPATQKSEVATSWQGIKLSSIDRTDNVFFRQTTFICSRLAPYTGWEDFFARTVSAWEAWKRAAGPTTLARIGVRYVNRIDIPVQNDTLLRVEDYLNVSPKSPENFAAPMSSYTMQIVRPLQIDDCSILLNSGTVPAPLIGFVSLALDIDIFREANLPPRDEDLWAILTRIRGHKNRVFESCITDRARALFDP